ncbi:hypothetical protein C8Q75DRAFT_754608 [Abortiporus biennis]|nr:hypothetical protein C8Q75DRAFT_754608 [Abortiporus biennis]
MSGGGDKGKSRGVPSASQTASTEPLEQRRLQQSCAECRRSKLKCDRKIPCDTCTRRGCANICPNGQQPAVKGDK